MRNIGIFANPNNPNALRAVQQIIEAAKIVSFSCAVDGSLQILPAFSSFPTFADMPPEAILALGGDGTILRAAALAVPLEVPVLGVDFGRVGFMSGICANQIPEALRRLKAGDYMEDKRMLLSCSINGGEPRDCINEALLYKRRFSGVANIRVNIGGLDAGSVFLRWNYHQYAQWRHGLFHFRWRAGGGAGAGCFHHYADLPPYPELPAHRRQGGRNHSAANEKRWLSGCGWNLYTGH